MRSFFRKSILMLILALIIITMPSGNFIAEADTNKTEAYEVKIASGIEGKYRALKYVPVTVEFTSSEKDFNGEVEIRTDTGSASTYDAYSREVSVAKGETGKVTIPIKVLENSSSISVNLVEDGKVLYEKKTLISSGRVTESSLFLGMLTDDPTALSYVGNVTFDTKSGFTGMIEKVQLDENIIGENSLNIDGVDVIIINNYNMSNLKKEQYTALTSWLNKGGTLIIGSGANESKTINSIDSDFLNIKSKGSKEKSINIINENLNLIYSELEVPDGRVKIADNENPLVYSIGKGKGEILVTTFDLGLEPFISSNNSKSFIESLLADSANEIFEKNMMGGFNQTYYMVQELMRSIPINEIVGVKTLTLVFAIYVIVIGIVVYIVLKKLNKRDLTWVVIPILSIVFTLVIYLMGSKTRVNDILLNQNNIISVDNNGKSTAKSYLAIGSKYKSDIVIEKPDDLSMEYDSGDNNYYISQEQDVKDILRVKTTYSGNNSYFTFNESDALDMKSFQVSGKEQVISKIESELSIEEGKLKGKVKNTLGYDINKLILVVGKNVWDIGKFNKDEEREISSVSTSSSNGLESYAQNLSLKYNEAKWQNKGDLNSEEFKNIVRISSLVGAVSSEIVINKDAKLIAITDMPVEYDIDFGNKSVSKFDTTAIVQNTELQLKDENGVYNFPDGYFEGVIESSSNTINIDPYNGYIYGNGEVVFKYEVDTNIQITDLTIKKSMDRYGNSIDNNSEKYIYNYKTDTYDTITMSQGYEEINDLDSYINNNTIKVKYIVDDTKGQSMMPMITVKGRDR